MSTTDSTPAVQPGQPKRASRRQPISFAEWMVVLNAMAPLLLLMYDARMHHLGADPIGNALGTTGSLALGLLAATLAITPLCRMTGWNGLVEYRRPLGLVAFFYGLSHVAIYVGYDQGWNWSIAWQEICQRRYLQFGGISLVLLVPLALTSSPWWIARLSFRRWKLLHRLIYPSAILATIHYWWQSKADLQWQIGFVLAVSGLLIFRIVDWLTAKRKSEVVCKPHTTSVSINAFGKDYVIDCDDGETILEAAERNRIPLASHCRSGKCGTCKLQMTDGDVEMKCEQALTDQQKSSGEILACQAICQSAEVAVTTQLHRS